MVALNSEIDWIENVVTDVHRGTSGGRRTLVEQQVTDAPTGLRVDSAAQARDQRLRRIDQARQRRGALRLNLLLALRP